MARTTLLIGTTKGAFFLESSGQIWVGGGGTNAGSIFASTDRGTTWSEVARHLPTVLCVECHHRTS